MKVMTRPNETDKQQAERDRSLTLLMVFDIGPC